MKLCLFNAFLHEMKSSEINNGAHGSLQFVKIKS